MGTFSSKAASALDKVLKRKTLVDIGQLLSRLQLDLDNCVQETASIEQEADRVLDVRYDAAGHEVLDRGPLTANLTRNLDGPSITRAILATTNAYDIIKAERATWVIAEKAKWEAGNLTKHIEFREDHNDGPGTHSWIFAH